MMRIEDLGNQTMKVTLDDYPFAVRTESSVRKAVRKVLPVCTDDLEASCNEALETDRKKFINVLFGKRPPGIVGDAGGETAYRIWYRTDSPEPLTDPVLFADPDKACTVAAKMVADERADSAYVESEDGTRIYDSTEGNDDWIWLRFGPLAYTQGLSKEEAMFYVLINDGGMTHEKAAETASRLHGYTLSREDANYFWSRAKIKILNGQKTERTRKPKRPAVRDDDTGGDDVPDVESTPSP